MKPLFLCTLLLFSSFSIFSRPQLQKLSCFRIQDDTEIRKMPNFDSEPKYQSLNHEGGLNVKVLEIGKSDIFENQKGKWFYVLLTAPTWVKSGEFLERYEKYWIFLKDETEIFDFEE